MEGQISIFDCVPIIWKKYPGNIIGYCPFCLNEVVYSANYKKSFNKVYCQKCGITRENVTMPDDLKTLSGINDEEIALVINMEAYTHKQLEQEAKKKNLTVSQWLKLRRCTEWFSFKETEAIDNYIKRLEE